MFNNLAMDPACYVDVDMTMIVAYDSYASKVGNPYVNKLVQRAGHNLRWVWLLAFHVHFLECHKVM